MSVPVSVWLPPGYDAGDESFPAVYSLERYAVPIGDWPGSLDAAVGDRVVPLIGVMIDAPEGFYGRRGGGRIGLVVADVVEAIDERYRTLAEPEHRGVVGALYTASPALSLSLGEDRLFARVAVQSPFALDAVMPMYRQQIARSAGAPRPSSFYFEWSHWEVRSPSEGLVLGNYMEELYELFRSEGYDLQGGEVWDSSDWAGWRNRTGVILEALFPSARGNAGERLREWLVDGD